MEILPVTVARNLMVFVCETGVVKSCALSNICYHFFLYLKYDVKMPTNLSASNSLNAKVCFDYDCADCREKDTIRCLQKLDDIMKRATIAYSRIYLVPIVLTR